jgi:electron transfer flavoprotein alpha subunit
VSGPVLAVATLAGAAPDRASLEALTLARSVAGELGSTLEVLLVADAAAARGAATSLAGRGVATAIVVEHDRLTTDHPDGWAAAVAEVAEARGAAAVVGPGTERGNDLLARVAVRLDVPLAANCLTVAPGER